MNGGSAHFDILEITSLLFVSLKIRSNKMGHEKCSFDFAPFYSGGGKREYSGATYGEYH